MGYLVYLAGKVLTHTRFYGSCISWHDIFSITKAVDELDPHSSRHQDATVDEFMMYTQSSKPKDGAMEFKYAVFSSIPNRRSAAEVKEDHSKIGIAWKVRWQEEESGEYWQSTDYCSALPYVWMPDGGNDLLLHFLRCLKQKWIELTDSEKNSLEKFVSTTNLFPAASP